MGSGTSGINVSEKYKFIWVAPERTGSRKVAEVLTYYGFTNNGKRVFNTGEYSYNHYYIPSEKYDDYKIICCTRNPYSRVYSIFKNYYMPVKDKGKDSFKKYLINDIQNSQIIQMIVNPALDQKPDYIIRMENMTEDLLKLPFISDVLTKVQVIMLSSHGKEIESWEEYYDQESKDIVYHYCKDHFIFGGYEK